MNRYIVPVIGIIVLLMGTVYLSCVQETYQPPANAVCMTVDALQLLKTEQYDTGFVAGYEKATKETANYPRLKDPSYKQVLSLIKGNVCDRCGVDSKVRCQYASACLINSAKDAGYKSHLVIISDYEALSHHALVCFDTDKGKVYVEPQVNKTVAVVVGKHYEYLCDFMVSEIVHFP